MADPAPITRRHTLGVSEMVSTPEGRQLHTMVSGAGPCTVVLESGMGMSRSSWGLVAPAVAQQARVVVYDRAGTGRSDADDRGRSLAHLVDDLLTVVGALGQGPLVLVGHSWGGPIVRTAAARLGPDRVCGVVAVDPVDEHCDLYFGSSARRRFSTSARLLPLMARVGLYRLAGSRAGRVQPADVAADHAREDFTLPAARAMAAELTTFLDDLADLRDRPPDLTGIRLTIVSGTRATRADRSVRAAITTAHRLAAESVPGARLAEASRSAHLVMFTEPDIVVEEVRRLLPA